MYHYNPETTDVFEISLYVRYMHLLTLIRFHSLNMLIAIKSKRFVSESYHRAAIERWDEMACECENQLTANAVRELTSMVYCDFTHVDQVNTMLDTATSAIKLSNSQFAMRA